MDEEALMAAARAMWAAWARISDPKWEETRWNRLPPAVKAQFVLEAGAAIQTYQSLTQRKR